MCVGCREEKPKTELIRVIRSKEGDISLDMTGKANGRGAYICKSADCLKKAVKNRGLERSLKTQIPEEVLGRIEKELL
jgi:predicted RNA-binding protein YlxR (DUF448 family)